MLFGVCAGGCTVFDGAVCPGPVPGAGAYTTGACCRVARYTTIATSPTTTIAPASANPTISPVRDGAWYREIPGDEKVAPGELYGFAIGRPRIDDSDGISCAWPLRPLLGGCFSSGDGRSNKPLVCTACDSSSIGGGAFGAGFESDSMSACASAASAEAADGFHV